MSPRPEVTERNYVPNLVEEASRALPSTTSKASKFTTVLGENFEDQPLWKRLNYLHLIILVGLPAFAVYGMLTTPLTMNVFAFSVFYYFFSGLGITAGACAPSPRSPIAHPSSPQTRRTPPRRPPPPPPTTSSSLGSTRGAGRAGARAVREGAGRARDGEAGNLMPRQASPQPHPLVPVLFPPTQGTTVTLRTVRTRRTPCSSTCSC